MSLRDRTYVRLLGRPDSAGRSPWGGTDSASPAGLEAVEVAGLPGYPWAPPPGQHAPDGSDPRPIQCPVTDKSAHHCGSDLAGPSSMADETLIVLPARLARRKESRSVCHSASPGSASGHALRAGQPPGLGSIAGTTETMGRIRWQRAEISGAGHPVTAHAESGALPARMFMR